MVLQVSRFSPVGNCLARIVQRRSIKTTVARKTAFDNTSDVLGPTTESRPEGSQLFLVRPGQTWHCSFVCSCSAPLGPPVVDLALTLVGKKVLCRSPCWLQTNIYGQDEGTVQASGTIERGQQGFPCWSSGPVCGVRRRVNICGRAMRSSTEQRRRAGFSHGTTVTAGLWALGLKRSLKRTCTPCPGQRVAGWGYRRGPVLPARAFNPCCCCPRPPTYCTNGAGFMARAVPFVLRHTTWCGRVHRLSTRRPGPTLMNALVGEVGGRRRRLRPTQ